MAETVLSMARLMLRGAVKKATSAAADEMSLLMGVRKDIWFMKDELKTMQAFLVAAEAMKKKNMLLRVWAEQIAIQIRDLKSRVEEVSMRNTRYNLIKPEGPNTNDEVDSYMEDVRNHSASNVDEADLVGFAKPKEELIKLMDVHSDHGHAKVICVVGMGGLGKTTLARKTYESKEHVVNSFSSCAWITVSQSFAKKEMLKDMIRQLLGDESLKRCLSKLEGKTVQIEDLAEYLTEKLKDKRDENFVYLARDNVTSSSGENYRHIAYHGDRCPNIGEPDERADVVAELHMNFTSLRSKSKGVRVPRGIGNLKELQILEVVDIKRTGSKAVKELGELMQLKELSVVTQGASEKKCKILCRAIEKLSPLCSLNVDSSESQYTGGTLEWLHCISSPPPLLRTLELNGCLGEEITDWFGNLTNLVNITLRGSNLKGVKTMEILGALPNLMFLRLYWQSCVAKKLVFKAGAFPSIRKLDIYELPVREIRFEKGAAPKMEMIEIWECNLWSGISGVNQLPRLKEISLGFFGRVVRLGLLQEELDKHPNHPVLRMPSGRGLHELRDDIYTETEGSSVEEEEAPESSLPEPVGEVTSRTVDRLANFISFTNW
ncbi:hypothetical protein ACQ4PT_072366 [Festuca glaucescens]